ncbi:MULTISPECIES: hypothetical protein [Pseudobacillus]|uniref:hypothetical protein n=1 Tax=Pseudobacillus TaxID=108525 RepID=UPI003879A4D3
MEYNSIEKRDLYCKAILKEYLIDDYFKSVLKHSIPKYANSNLSQDNLDRMLNKKMSIYTNINTLRTNINIFSGYIYEFLCVYEYNMYRNNENVTTILNPDPSSKTDLLHIIKTTNGHFVVPGGDVKSGSPNYVLNQYEKLLKTKYDIPFIDYSGYLTINKHLLSTKQRERLENLLTAYPNKKPIKSSFSPNDLLQIKKDVLAYFETGYLPSEIENYNLNFEIKKYADTRENREELIRSALLNKKENDPVYWSYLGKSQETYYKSSSNCSTSYYEEPEWKQIKSELEAELQRLKETRNSLVPFKKLSDRNIFKKIFKVSVNGIVKKAYDLLYDDKIKELKHRIKSNDFSMNVEEIYDYLEEKKRIENEEDDYEGFMYYFDDDTPLNDDDMAMSNIERNSPIKHNVRAHTRTLKSGKVVSVRSHERGK